MFSQGQRQVVRAAQPRQSWYLVTPSIGGQIYQTLVEASVLWKMHLKDLVNYSETRFANSPRQMYINLHHDLQPVVVCLEDKVELSDENPSNGKLTEKAREAKQLLGKLVNAHFLLQLAGCADAFQSIQNVINTQTLTPVSSAFFHCCMPIKILFKVLVKFKMLL